MKTFNISSPEVIEQLEKGQEGVTKHNVCDLRIITFLRNRTLGKPPSNSRASLSEQYTKQMMMRSCLYLSDCQAESSWQASLKVLTTDTTYKSSQPLCIADSSILVDGTTRAIPVGWPS